MTLQGWYAFQPATLHTSTILSKDLTEGSSTIEPPKSGFQKLRHNVTNLFVAAKSGDAQENEVVDR